MTDLLDVVKDVFEKRYGEPPQVIVRAPGRVNLIGEHTDYNDGFVLPIAIDRATWIAFRPTQDGQVRLHSLDFDEDVTFDLAQLSHKPGKFVDYLEGIAWGLQEAGYTLRGFEGVMAGNVPIGAGLSSSAALELTTAKAFSEASGFAWHAVEMARLSQHVENKWVGLQCGIMDQLISAVGERDHAVLIDCRSLETKLALIPPGSSVVVLDTGTRRGLVGEAYNERRQQCEAVAAHFGLPALRDVSLDQLEREQGQIDAVNYRRARHIVTENQRTLDAYDAMQNEDAVWLGQLMNASHDSLRDDFEVSSAALNAMVDLARQQPGCLGARMTGAGFGGCAVALVDSAYVEQFQQDVAERYRTQTGSNPQLYLCVPSDGARTI